MISKNKTRAATSPSSTTATPEPEETQGANNGANGDNGADDFSTPPEPAWDYALIGKLSHRVHSFDELYTALSAEEGFERNRSGVANQVRRMLTVASNPKRPLPNLINPEVKPNAKPRIDWEGIAAQAGEGIQAAG